MINIGALNTAIALVIVLLVLSLIVQSIQSLVKKAFKMKTKVFVNSIIDLFQYVDSEKLLGKKPEVLLNLVREEFRKLGRETLFGQPMLDSISKEDLLKIVDKIVRTHPELKDFDPVNVRAELQKWFETVMQGFDERYSRHMKTAAVVIAFFVVVVLNANIFTVYHNIATSDVLQAQILSMADQVKKQAAAASEATKKEQAKKTPDPTSADTPAPAKPTPRVVAGSSPPKVQPSPTPAGTPANQSDKQAEDDAKQNAKDLQGYLNEYQGFGFAPLKPKQLSDFVWGQGVWAGADKPFFWVRAAHGAKVLMGWLIMTLLLSVGAPFWQDALESLFGLKGLIRKKGETQNVEQGQGGQDKP